MLFEDYKRFVFQFKEICKGFPEKPETLIIHFDDCNRAIGNFETFKRCWHKWRESSPFFPLAVDLKPLSLPKLPALDAEEILRGSSMLGRAVNDYLCENYGLALPSGQEIANSMRKDYDKWLNQIRFYLPKFVQDYKDLKTDNKKLFNQDVIKELGLNQNLTIEVRKI